MSDISIQFDEQTCALSSLRNLAYLKTKKKGWKNLTFQTHPPYSLKILEEEMFSYGFKLRFFHSEKEDFSYPFNKEEPFLVLLKEGEGTHMVVVSSIENDEVIYLDPAVGKLKKKKERFVSAWTGIWGDMEQYMQLDPPKAERILPLWQEIVTNGLLFLAEVSLGLSLAFLDKAPLWLFLTFMALSIVFEEIRRIFILNSIKRFDKKYIDEVYDDDLKRMRTNYERFNALKKNLFADAAAVLSEFGSSFFIAIIAGINTPSFFLSLGGVMALLCGEKFIFNRYFSSKRKRMEKEEGLLYKSNEESEKKQLLFSLSKESNKYGKMLFLERSILIVAVAFFSLLTSILTNDSSLNFYLFHLFALLFVGRGASNVFDYAFSKKEREINILYFREYFAKGK